MSSAARKALVVLGATAAAIVTIMVVSGGGGDGYYVNAAFRDVGGLRKNSSVKVAGVPAGKVKDLTVTRDRAGNDIAIVKLKIDDNAAPLGHDATIAVRPTDLLGERYAEIDPGDTNAPLASGATIPVRSTSTPVELDDILNTLDADTRTRLGILVNEIGTGLAGRGGDFNKLLATLPPSLVQTRKLIDQVASQNASLKSLITKGDRITAAVNGRRNDMGKLVDVAAAALTTVAQKRRELGATIQNAPGALRQLRSTLASLDTASVELRPAAVELHRAAAPLNSTLKALPAFTDQAAPTLKTATEVAPQLSRLGRVATPTVGRLATTAALLKRVVDPANPLLAHMDKRGTDDLLYFINNMNRGLKQRDGISHVLSSKLFVSSEYITDAINAFNGYQPPPAARQPSKPALELPKLTVPHGKLPDAVKRATDRILPTVTNTVAPKVTKAVNELVRKAVGPPPTGPRNAHDADARILLDYLLGP